MPSQPTPTISRCLPDGTLIELTYNPAEGTTALAVAPAGDAASLHNRVELPSGETLLPYDPSNSLLASGCVLLPARLGEYGSKAQLLACVKAFLHRHVDLSPLFEEIAAHYVLFSWVHDAFNEAPMLRLKGDFGTGKTRALLAIGSLCHKAFFASGASTVSPIFHILDAFGGTLVLDEADLRMSDATADLVKIFNNGTTRGLPVLRTMTNRHRELNPTAFRVFGPKIIAMREAFQDEALESRFLTETMARRALRHDISLHTPDSLKTEAQELRDRLLSWRFAAHSNVSIDRSRAITDLSARGNQMALPLLSLIDDATVRKEIGAHLLDEEALAQARRASQPHVAMVGVLNRLFVQNGNRNVPIAEVARDYNDSASASLPVKSVGHIVRSRLGLETRKTSGIYVVPAHERSKVTLLAEHYRLACALA